MKKLTTIIILMCFAISINTTQAFAGKLDKRIGECTDLFDEVMEMPDKAIPEDLLKNCAGVAIFPSVLKGGFMIGGRFGRGVILYRNKKTNEWSAPAFYTIGGLSYGLQIGGQAIDLILVITNKRGLESLLRDKVTLGGDAAVAVGPLGRTAEAATDLMFKAGILSYSRSRGLFAGVALKGAVIKPDYDANESYYSDGISPEDILYEKKARLTPAGKELIKALERHSK